MNKNSICIVAIVKFEEVFLDEWILYHKSIGVNHFFLYDDDPCHPLHLFLKPHSKYVTVIDWHGQHKDFPGKNRQIKAYLHASANYAGKYDWVAFIDADEFIVLRDWKNIKSFLSDFSSASAISLNWHVFGHNGNYSDSQDLIIESLTRRMSTPSNQIKTITRTHLITEVASVHYCKIAHGTRFDANHIKYTDPIYPDKTKRAHINHYQCRSFERWMLRVERGDNFLEDRKIASNDLWKIDRDLCLKQFVTTVALNKNEYVDRYMIKFVPRLKRELALLKRIN